ncbi:hypothetical protein KAT92_05495 [Candidatus Babeliales bacterium]|nr:hypothetical protein [Candidatus Babeliales bacterium]
MAAKIPNFLGDDFLYNSFMSGGLLKPRKRPVKVEKTMPYAFADLSKPDSDDPEYTLWKEEKDAEDLVSEKPELKRKKDYRVVSVRTDVTEEEIVGIRARAFEIGYLDGTTPPSSDGVWVKDHAAHRPEPEIVWFPYKTGADSSGAYWRAGGNFGYEVLHVSELSEKHIKALKSGWLRNPREGRTLKDEVFNRFRLQLFARYPDA